MKQIEPVIIWSNGEEKTASILTASIIQDNLESSCSFYYQLSAASQTESTFMYNIALAQGNVNMSGEEYLAWDGSSEAAYNYVAAHLNLTIVTEE